MAAKVVKVRLPMREVKKHFTDLPGILSGRLPDPFGLRRLFYAHIARFLYRLIHEAFEMKSKGGTDSLGYSWRALKPSTIRRRLSRSLLDRFPLSAKLYILRISDAIYDSLEPGQVTGTEYHPRPNQIYELTADGLAIGSKLRHATHVSRQRPLWPGRMKPWIREAANYALIQTVQYLTNRLTESR